LLHYRLSFPQNEPVRLKLEAENLNEELDSLVMDNYRVFVENLTCSVYLRDEVSFSSRGADLFTG
jgi:hypothetical protein